MSKSRRGTFSTQNRNNWMIDAVLFLGAIVAVLSGIYFLFLPSGGIQGGRNPMYGVTVLFSWHTWEAIHMWGGVLMISIAILHFALHWRWVEMMARRTMNSLLSGRSQLSKKAMGNLILDVVVALSFLLTAASGIYFLFAPSGGIQGGAERRLGSGVPLQPDHLGSGPYLGGRGVDRCLRRPLLDSLALGEEHDQVDLHLALGRGRSGAGASKDGGPVEG